MVAHSEHKAATVVAHSESPGTFHSGVAAGRVGPRHPLGHRYALPQPPAVESKEKHQKVQMLDLSFDAATIPEGASMKELYKLTLKPPQ